MYQRPLTIPLAGVRLEDENSCKLLITSSFLLFLLLYLFFSLFCFVPVCFTSPPALTLQQKSWDVTPTHCSISNFKLQPAWGSCHVSYVLCKLDSEQCVTCTTTTWGWIIALSTDGLFYRDFIVTQREIKVYISCFLSVAQWTMKPFLRSQKN